MHKTQLKILEISARKNIEQMGLRELGREIGVKHPQVVHYHLTQLKKRGLLRKNSREIIEKLQRSLKKSIESLVNIPILGTANCGAATLFANESLEGYLKISPKLLPRKGTEGLFALRAEGDSMNKANITGKKVDEGDYLLVDSNQTTPKNGDYVLSIIDGCANIKKLKNEGNRIVLFSESTGNYPPIYIHPDDDYLINGLVVDVIKGIGGDKNGKSY